MESQNTWLESNQELAQQMAETEDPTEQAAIQFLMNLRSSDQSFAQDPEKVYRSKKHQQPSQGQLAFTDSEMVVGNTQT